MSDLESTEAKRSSSTAERGMRGLQDIFDPHMLEVCWWLPRNKITPANIAGCCVKAHILPVVYAADINAVEGRCSRRTVR